MLMEDWAAQGGVKSLFDSRNSGVFLLSFNPRKYAWHPSPVALNDLNSTEARAWVLRAFARGVEGGETMLAKDLEGLTEWWLFGVLLGVGYVVRKLHQDADHTRLVAFVQKGITAHEAARTRQQEGS